MKVYFGRASETADTQDCYKQNGKFFYYELDFDEDGFTLADTCGRKIPFDKADVHSLINMLCYMRDYQTASEFTTKHLGSALNRLASYYNLESPNV